ncbi:DUF6215 domain-containing protein [Streptomyces sp. NBC_00582]|uniref:DUF6215 domain-containing protein n=1 Tax=Streptomyces sp. NBC_00582 TaxID=2975783 RepID=UPI0010E1F672|nr:DUF6215 domain-containing protein [Streptomyces sp. NBC_00582]WUB64911.1 DUF6215 domain-containing protein [Streptomyces sp. NBC_00582]
MGESAERAGTAGKGPNAFLQITAAFAVVGLLAWGLWTQQKHDRARETAVAGPTGPISCSASTPKAVPKMVRAGVKYVSANQLCQVLNRPDLATLLGTPGERAMSYGGGDDSVALGGADLPAPEMNVTLRTYSVQLSASYDHFAVKGMADLLGGDARERTFLGRPAVLYSDRTFPFVLGGDGDSAGGPGRPTRRLVVARDPHDGGGSYDIALWRLDSARPDDAVLLRLAARILPTLPGWSGTSG